MASLQAHGLRVEHRPGWDVQIYRRAPQDGSTAYPVMHAGNFPLPRRRGDFGVGAVERMGFGHVLVVLFEYEPAAGETPMFARTGFPKPRPADFQARALQRTLPGQAGAQWFFTEHRRPFSLYVVLGSDRRRATLVPLANQLLGGLSVSRSAVIG